VARQWLAVFVTTLATAVATASCAHDDIGTGVWVHDFRIEGNHALSTGAIRDRLATQATGWWPFAKKQWFDQAALDLDLRRIPAFYADHGYFDARVVGHEVKWRDSKSVDIVITVQENSPTKIREVALQGFPSALQHQARKATRKWDVTPGTTFNYDDYAAAKSKLEEQQREAGYAYGTVAGEVRVDRDQHTADVSLEGHPGPRVRFGKTVVQGNGGIPPSAILNRLTWNEGDVFNPHDIATTQGRLYNLAVFSSVRLVLPEQPVEVADVRVEVSPGSLHELRLGAGLGVERVRQEVRARAEYTKANFLGGLRRLRIRVRPGYVVIPSVFDVQRKGVAAENDIQLTQPDIFGTRWSAHGLIGYDVGIDYGYQNYGPRAQVGIDRPFFRDRLLAGGSWNLQYLTFFNVDQAVFNTASSGFFGYENPYRLAYVEGFAQIDLRDRPLSPTYGGYLILRVEEGSNALGSDFGYTKLTPDLRLYAPLGRRVVLAARALVGWLSSYGDKGSPITRRYYLGGPSSHRGFNYGRLSPQVLDTSGRLIPVGGDGELLFSGELRVKATKIGGNWVNVVPFFDAGDVTATFADLDVGNLHLATGASLEYETPIGVVRGGVGIRLNRLGPGNPDPGDRFVLHITIGEAF
jgi:translocation and assembly module TamA